MRKIWVQLSALLALLLVQAPHVQAQNAGEGKKLYANYCVTCHGDNAKGDGVASRSLPVKPADHTNGAVMNQLSDKFLKEIITKGGSAVGKSPFMPAWGSSLTDKQVLDIVAYLRSIVTPPYNPEKKVGN